MSNSTKARIRPLSVGSIKKSFPVPQLDEDPNSPALVKRDPEYCVMGAVGLYMKEKCPSHKNWLKTKVGKTVTVGNHPGQEECARILQRLNPRLTDDQAIEYAHSITQSNDDGEFEDAWEALQVALTAKTDKNFRSDWLDHEDEDNADDQYES